MMSTNPIGSQQSLVDVWSSRNPIEVQNKLLIKYAHELLEMKGEDLLPKSPKFLAIRSDLEHECEKNGIDYECFLTFTKDYIKETLQKSDHEQHEKEKANLICKLIDVELACAKKERRMERSSQTSFDSFELYLTNTSKPHLGEEKIKGKELDRLARILLHPEKELGLKGQELLSEEDRKKTDAKKGNWIKDCVAIAYREDHDSATFFVATNDRFLTSISVKERLETFIKSDLKEKNKFGDLFRHVRINVDPITTDCRPKTGPDTEHAELKLIDKLISDDLRSQREPSEYSVGLSKLCCQMCWSILNEVEPLPDLRGASGNRFTCKVPDFKEGYATFLLSKRFFQAKRYSHKLSFSADHPPDYCQPAPTTPDSSKEDSVQTQQLLKY